MATNLALEGIKVLDLSRVLAGPWCSQILADFGADVVKVEAPGKGDDTRSWGPPNLPAEPGQPEPGHAAYYLACNRNKRSVSIDLSKPGSPALIKRLAEKADIVIENFKVGGLKKYGLDYDSLKEVNPRMVYCSITGFGQTGPYSHLPGYDFVAQAMGGMMSLTGEKDGPPLKPGVALADVSTGMYATVSILMALRHAERTGVGQYIDCSLLDTQISMLANHALSYLVSGSAPSRMGNVHPNVVPYGIYHASDGPFVVAVGNDKQYAGLCDALGHPEMATDPRYANNRVRVENRAALEPELQALISQHKANDLMADLSARGVPCGPVNTVEQIFQDPFCEARGVVQHFERPDGVKVPSVAFPGKLSVTPARYEKSPPGVGEDTVDALADWLELDEGEFDRLGQEGVFGKDWAHVAAE